MGSGPKAPALIFVVKYMVVIKVIVRRCRNIGGVTLGLGQGPKGPALMAVVKYMVVIRFIAKM